MVVIIGVYRVKELQQVIEMSRFVHCWPATDFIQEWLGCLPMIHIKC